MGTINLNLPESMSEEARLALRQARLLGGPDTMPTPTAVTVDEDRLTLVRSEDSSGYLAVPMEIDGFGHLMTATATLIERDRAYSLRVEVARGKVNQVRNQSEDWKIGGLQVTPLLQQQIREASQAVGRAVTRETSEEREEEASRAILLGHEAAQALVRAYVNQIFQIRQHRQPRLDTHLSSRIYPTEDGPPRWLRNDPAPVLDALNSVAIPFAWHQVETEETIFQWERHERLLDLALDLGWHVTGGPLIDFSSSQLPGWLWLWEGDLNNLASIMCKYVETVVSKYHQQIRRWVICAAPNCAQVLRLSGEELLGLTYRMFDTARQIDDSLELVLSLGQPWGEHLSEEPFINAQSPYFFVDTLLRAGGDHLNAIEVEIVMGPQKRGSFCHDILDVSKILDLYAFLGLPLHVTLGYPASTDADPKADPELVLSGGHWGEGISEEAQADWALEMLRLVLAKPFVHSAQWVHVSDSESHLFPNVGLLDAGGKPRKILSTLKNLREERLK